MALEQLSAKNGFGAVPAGSYTLLVGENIKRKWFTLTVPTGVAACYVCLTYGADISKQYGLIYILPGASLTFDNTAEWYGSILAQGVGAASYCYWTECSRDD